MMVRRHWHALWIVAVLASPAHAGLDCDSDESMKLVEAFAKSKASPPPDNSYAWLCVSLDAPKLRKRIGRACRTILDRDKASEACVFAAASAGIGKLGDHDIFDAVTKLHEDPIEFEGGVGWTKTDLLGQIADPRGVAIVVEMWKSSIPRADKRQKRHGSMTDWSSWRQKAAGVLGAIGGADEQQFLDAQETATVDKAVARACHDGSAAIAKRLAAAKP